MMHPPSPATARKNEKLSGKRSFFGSLALILALAATDRASAALVIQWDFSTASGSYTGTVSPGNQVEPGVVTGSTWNTLAPFTGIGSGYLDQNGAAATGVTLELALNDPTETISASGSGSWGFDAPFNYGEGASSTAIYNTAMATDYFYVHSGGILGVRVSGLAAGTYNVYVPTVESAVPIRARTIGIGTGVVYTQFGDAVAVNASGTAGSETTWIDGVNYTFKQVTLTGTSDYVDVLVTRYSIWDSPGFNGLQIVGVPEPSTVALLAVGALALTVRRRFRISGRPERAA